MNKTWECWAALRWVERDEERVLQQLWVRHEDGKIEWRDVPVDNEQ